MWEDVGRCEMSGAITLTVICLLLCMNSLVLLVGISIGNDQLFASLGLLLSSIVVVL